MAFPPYSIQEAQYLFDVYGTVSVIDSDKHTVIVYDDENDMIANNPIIECSIA